MLIHTSHRYLAPEGAAGGSAAGDDLIEVDIDGGVKVKLPKAEADKAIAARDSKKASLREWQDKAGRLEADKNAADAARVKAEEDKQAADHAKKGELDQLRTLLTKGHTEREAKISATLRDKALRAAIATTPKVVPAAVGDIVDQLRTRSRYDFESDAVVVLDEAGQPLKDDAGKPVQVDAWLGSWLAKRPHYLLDSTPPGSGAEGGTKTGSGVVTEKRSNYGRVIPAEVQQRIAKGELRLVD